MIDIAEQYHPPIPLQPARISGQFSARQSLWDVVNYPDEGVLKAARLRRILYPKIGAVGCYSSGGCCRFKIRSVKIRNTRICSRNAADSCIRAFLTSSEPSGGTAPRFRLKFSRDL